MNHLLPLNTPAGGVIGAGIGLAISADTPHGEGIGFACLEVFGKFLGRFKLRSFFFINLFLRRTHGSRV